MLDLMLQSRNISTSTETTDRHHQMSDTDIVDDILLFTVAGHETITTALCWTLLELARNPDIQELCREEALSVVTSECPLDYKSCDR